MSRVRRVACTLAGLVFGLFLITGVVQAGCATASTGARCISAGETPRAEAEVGRRVQARVRAPAFVPGDVLPWGRYLRLLNSEYYGLPPVDGDWRYYEVEGRVLRVEPDTMKIIGDATAETNGAF
jgi:hypothetical protein